ncbi:hypothetical protein [Paraburkholderia hospita]|uniref:hypothetical protein n=1 Tax=Paraburkholderia hospita TaxID=169430 RepID=UPI0012600F8C|nr:hypothetical protein [Paraburkholderia hospita]
MKSMNVARQFSEVPVGRFSCDCPDSDERPTLPYSASTSATFPLPNQQEVTRQLVLFRRLMTNRVTVGPDTPLSPLEECRKLMLEVSRGADKFIAALEDGYRTRYTLR